MDPKGSIIFSLLYAVSLGNYMLAFDYAVTLAHITNNSKVKDRLEGLRAGVEIKPGVNVPFVYLIHQYSRMKDDNLKRKVSIYTKGRTKIKISVGDILEGIRFVNRIVLISCFQVMETEKINVDIAELYRNNPDRASI
jgi:hypothetical protein